MPGLEKMLPQMQANCSLRDIFFFTGHIDRLHFPAKGKWAKMRYTSFFSMQAWHINPSTQSCSFLFFCLPEAEEDTVEYSRALGCQAIGWQEPYPWISPSKSALHGKVSTQTFMVLEYWDLGFFVIGTRLPWLVQTDRTLPGRQAGTGYCRGGD